ncbi:hypothetical protein N7453_001883 [Penicillium expansum]|nr:hypothetical protein N7453_001883 [Penicillium expansum]
MDPTGCPPPPPRSRAFGYFPANITLTVDSYPAANSLQTPPATAAHAGSYRNRDSRERRRQPSVARIQRYRAEAKEESAYAKSVVPQDEEEMAQLEHEDVNIKG